jgi:XTP/dITP diphosphohydrolase
MEIVLATKNRGKVREIKDLLRDMKIEIRSLLDFPEIPPIEETGENYRENAGLKASLLASRTGRIALADDSGLEVDALDGKPGKHSARFIDEKFSDEERNRALLELLKGIPPSERTARFRCVIAIAKPKGDIVFCEGVCEGVISEVMKGEKGFGYDPVFYVPKFRKTFAEMDMLLKNKLSHRGIALKKAKKVLAKLLQEK